MREMVQHGSTHIFASTANLLIDDGTMIYLYCLACGGIKMCHLYLESGVGVAQEQQLIRETLLPCQCKLTTGPRSNIQQMLANLYISIGTCRTIEEAREMVMIAASREDMREGQAP